MANKKKPKKAPKKKRTKTEQALFECFDMLQLLVIQTANIGLVIEYTIAGETEKREAVNELVKWCAKYGSLVGLDVK